MKKLLLSILVALCSLGLVKAQGTADNVQVLINTDFSVFTEGSEESPKSLYSSSFNSKVEGYYMISDVSAVGGKILVGGNGSITLKPFASLPSAGGTIRITMEVKMLDAYGGALQFTRGYSTSDVVYATVDSDDWTTVTVYAGGYTNTTSSRLKVQPFLSLSGMYVKSLKVEYSPDFLVSPTAYLPSDADGTQFTASCSRVSGAAKYEADVFSLNDKDEPVYFQQDVELKALGVYSDPTAKITGLDPTVTYYYVARAVNADGKKSENSEVVEVVKKISSIAAPVASAATGITESGFTANWSAVADAKSYVVYAYEKETLKEEGEVTVFDEDFSGVNVGTVSNIEFTGALDDFTKLPGWEADYSSKAFAAGYYVFSPYSGPGTLTTPAIDLSANGGKFTVVLTGFTGAYGQMKATQNTIVAEIVNGEEVVETAAALVCDKDAPSGFVFNFTKGSASTRIRFTYTQVDGDGNKLFVDAISINQIMPAGTVISKLIANQAAEGVSAQVNLTPKSDKQYCYGVVAIGQTVIGTGANAAVGEILSEVSNLVDVDFSTSGVAAVGAPDAPKAWRAGEGSIGVNGSNVAVYDLTGRTLLRETLPAGTHTFALGTNGVVVVVVDGNTYKIAL